MQKAKFVSCLILSFFFVAAQAQSPGGVSAGLKTWYKADAVTDKVNGEDMQTWADQYSGDGAAQNAAQNPLNLHSYFGNRQPQFRSSAGKYNFNPYLDFSKYFSGFMAYQAHSTTPDYRLNFTKGATLYQVGDLTNNQGFYFGTGLGQSTPLYSGYRYNYGMPWWGINQQYYGTAVGYYCNTVDDYWWPQTPGSTDYNWFRSNRKTKNNIPYISSVSYDKFNTVYNSANPVVLNNDAATAIQTRVNGDKWSWRYSFTAPGSSLWIGNEYANYNAGRWWQGGISEVILYDRKLNTSTGNEADKVDSYLGLKYGVTLTHSYYLSDGVKVWDTACNKVYNKEIAGLVRDDASALYQKQARSNLKKQVVTISLGDINETSNYANTSVIETDKWSMVWGSNGSAGASQDNRTIPGGFSTFTTQVPGFNNCFTELQSGWTQKKWQVQEQTGKDLGSVKVYIESKDVIALDWTCPAYIVVGTDANFSNPKYYPLTLATGTSGSITDYVTDINFCEGAPNASTACGSLKSQYFAIMGKAATRFPGGVTGGLKFWVRADIGALNDATNKIDAVPGESSRVREWVNQVKGPSALAYFDIPTLRTPTRYDNFNSIVSFSDAGTYIGTAAAVGHADENKDPNDARMIATGVLGQTGYQADSLVMFSSHRNLTDWFNASIGIGRYGLMPGMMHDANYKNGVEYYYTEGGTINHAPGDTYRPGFTTPYGSGSNGSWTVGAPASSAYGRTYSSALYWYPANPANVTNTTSVAHQLRANGSFIRLNTITNIDSPYRVANIPNLGMGAYTNNAATYRRNDVMLAGGDALYSGISIHDAILYNRGMKAAEFETERIETYLGIRGGITMKHNYYATDKTLIWDTTNYVDASPNVTGYSRYNRSITGIGRDDIEALHQRVSRNAEDTVVTISLATIPQDENQASVDADFANDKEYILWGSNGGAMNARITTDLPTVLPGCIDSRINREYRIHLNGASGAYKTQVRWELDNNLLDNVSGTSLSLLIDDDGDGDFATGTYRVIPATSYDAAKNSAIFDNVTWSSAGDTNPSDAVMTLVWSQLVVGRPKEYNNTANGGPCPFGCPGAVETLTPVCNDANGWTFYQDNDNNRKSVAINWGGNTGTKTVSIDVSASKADKRKNLLNQMSGSTKTDYAATVGARMLNINYSGTLTEPVKVRFYYNDTPTTGEIDRDSSWVVDTSGVNEVNIEDSTWTWFKFEGTPQEVLTSLTHLGLPLGDGVTPLTYMALQPDVMGSEDGVKYVQFNYITSFSTIGYMQTYSKSSEVTTLPLNLLDFTVIANKGRASLNWTTDAEMNVKGFEIERSIDGSTFSTINFVPVSAAVGGQKTYQYIDNIEGLNGKIYYRLKIVDNDGLYSFSPVRFIVTGDQQPRMTLWPNPSQKEVNATLYSQIDELVTIKLVGLDGKLYITKKHLLNRGVNVINLPLGDIPVGTYSLIVIYKSGKREQQKLIRSAR